MRVLISTGFKEYGYTELAVQLSKHTGISLTLFTGLLLDSNLTRTNIYKFFKKKRPFASMNIRNLEINEVISLKSNCFLEIFSWFGTIAKSGLIIDYTRRIYIQRLTKFITNSDFDILILRPGYFPSVQFRIKTYALLGIPHPDYIVNKLPISTSDKNEYHSGVWLSIREDLVLADCIIVNSDFIKTSFPDEILNTPTYLLNNPINFDDIGEFFPEPVKKTILFVGEIGRRKGFDIVIQTMNLLFDYGFSLTCFGNVEQTFEKEFWEWYNSKKISNCIIYNKSISHKELLAIYPQHEYFLFPTRAEGCSRAVQEAMLNGLIVLTTRASGVEVLDGENGILIDEILGTPFLIHERINLLSSDLKLKIRSSARESIIENYSNLKYLDQIDEIVQSFKK